MKKFALPVYIFICLAVIQLAVPAGMMARWEYVLLKGEEFKFPMRPIDPVDVFRGRYVSIYLDEMHVPLPKEIRLGKDMTQGYRGFLVYAKLGRDRKGFGTVAGISLEEPDEGAYIRAHAYPEYSYSYDEAKGPNMVRIRLPFTTYYMNEFKAPLAERASWSRTREEASYITVKVLAGRGVISGLFINGKKAEELTGKDLKAWQVQVQ